ncbi:Hsp33 family molecular chaperone HslO [Catenisphaera adipataccumulans]|jgi:molecular chaperone Hsp33|uniref:33 kDa chaperonin n=1 Tax=Catenisphaera adipataccumulans TaxID=700500 RepID=A0A7W8CZT4_9FIRM|nr:Hsp33 family molecular chaperone HslO [Catenisphaera adipataccumulans]MBB5183394.1 molecular chaperone Hsp33 [Catenisphaera adipataccumulans]
MKDQLTKALVCEGRVRLYLARTTDLVQEARDRFDCYPCAVAALGRTLSVGTIMGSMLKSADEMLTIAINGGGPIGSIIVDAYSNGNVRGFCSNPHVGTVQYKSGKLNVGAVVGKDGTLTVTKDLHMAENFTGTVALQSGEIGEDFAYYFTLSEQIPTAVAVGVKIDTDGSVCSAGALVLQMMPDAVEADIQYCEHVIGGLKPISQIMEEYDDTTLEQLAKDMFDDAQILETCPVMFSCPCSKERMAEALSTIACEDLEAMIHEDHGAEVTCNFCNERYTFTEAELQEILQKKNEQFS